MAKSVSIYMVRHGETDWNAEERIQGHTDIPLNSKGTSQAEELNSYLEPLHFAAIFSSDLQRAKKTAEIINTTRNAPLKTSACLRERCMGRFEGKKLAVLNEHLKMQAQMLEGLPKEEYLAYRYCPASESFADAYKRVKTFLDQEIQNFSNKNVLLVTHHGIIRAILEHLEYFPGHKWTINNCGYIHLNYSDQSFELLSSQGIVKKSLY